jgi:hypothetical protein
MASGINSTANIDNVVRPMLAESRVTIEHEPTMKQLVRIERIPKGQGGTYRLPKWGVLPDAQDLTEGMDITQSQQLSDTLQTFTPTEVGHQVIITKRAMETLRDDIMRQAGRQMGDALQRRIDKDGLTMLDGFSTSLGSAGTALTWEYIAAAEVGIMGGGSAEPAPKSSPVYGVFHPYQLHPLAKDFAPAGTYPVPSGLSEDIQLKGFVSKSIAGVPLYRDGNLTIDANDDAKGGVFSKEALLLVWEEPNEQKEESISLRGWRVVQTVWYVYGEYKDAWGREMLFDSVAPTS